MFSHSLLHLFFGFVQLRRGTGLGLAVVAAVAKVHQGSIKVESDENSTVFTMIIPKYDGINEPTVSLADENRAVA